MKEYNKYKTRFPEKILDEIKENTQRMAEGRVNKILKEVYKAYKKSKVEP